MKQALQDLLDDVADEVADHPDAAQWVVWGARDGLEGDTTGMPDPADMTKDEHERAVPAWKAGYRIGKKHRGALS